MPFLFSGWMGWCVRVLLLAGGENPGQQLLSDYRAAEVRLAGGFP